MKKFIYVVNGVELEDEKAFGLAWAKAKELAKEQHTYITRYDVVGDKVTELYLANGMVFLTMNDKFNENVKIF